MSSADSVSKRRGSARGRPLTFVLGRFSRRLDDTDGGRARLGMDGELDGEADMRVSMSSPSSAFFLFLLVGIVEGGDEYAVRILALGGCIVRRG